MEHESKPIVNSETPFDQSGEVISNYIAPWADPAVIEASKRRFEVYFNSPRYQEINQKLDNGDFSDFINPIEAVKRALLIMENDFKSGEL